MSFFNETARAASSSIYTLTAPTLSLPITMAGWIYPQTGLGGTNYILGHGTFAGTGDSISFSFNDSANFFLASGTTGGGLVVSQAIVTLTNYDRWQFVIGVFTSSEVRIALLNNGVVTQTTSVLSSDMTSGPVVDTTAINDIYDTGGITSPGYGGVAECWMANVDPDPASTTVINADVVRQLAYGGPFSMAHIAPKVWEYYSLRESTPLSGDQRETYFGNGFARPTKWANDSGFPVFLGQNPPLPYSYVKPGQIKRTLVV